MELVSLNCDHARWPRSDFLHDRPIRLLFPYTIWRYQAPRMSQPSLIDSYVCSEEIPCLYPLNLVFSQSVSHFREFKFLFASNTWTQYILDTLDRKYRVKEVILLTTLLALLLWAQIGFRTNSLDTWMNGSRLQGILYHNYSLCKWPKICQDMLSSIQISAFVVMWHVLLHKLKDVIAFIKGIRF